MSNHNYYKVGGSLEYQHPTYVVRQADYELYEGLKNREFCYVLNSRQMGKSSLRVQTMKKLKEEGVKCAAIDMTRIGSHITSSEWYGGVVSELIRGFNLSRKIDFSTWWRQQELLSPVQRLGEFVEDVLLKEFSENIVIFIDEVDSTLKVPFKDDFFAFIRACYNKRADSPEYRHLTFAILGVATPSDLIGDRDRTPFNIGRTIQLNGFQIQEAYPLLKGLKAAKIRNSRALLETVLKWTGGQPFLTQKLCYLIVNEASTIPIWNEPEWVGELVQSNIIRNWEAQDEPEHLRTIRNRLLSHGNRTSRLLTMYQRLLIKGELIAYNSFEYFELRLSGLVVKEQEKLRVRNRIYQTIFDRNWVQKELSNLRPYSEAITAWLASNRQDTSRLLRGQALREALSWSVNKSLSDEDYHFLTLSQDLEKRDIQIALVKEKQSKRKNLLRDEFLENEFQRLLSTVSSHIRTRAIFSIEEDFLEIFGQIAVLERFLDVGTNLLLSQSLEDLLLLLLSESRRITQSDEGRIYLTASNEAGPVSSLQCKLTQSDSRSSALLQKFSLPLTLESAVGQVATTGSSLNIPDASSLSLDAPLYRQLVRLEDPSYKICSVLVVPIQKEIGKVIGVLQLINRKTKADATLIPENTLIETQPYSSLEERIIGLLATQAAILIEQKQFQ